jgi:hypothetical protein
MGSNKRLMARTMTGETKRKVKERAKDKQPTRTKKMERVSPFHGRKVFHPQPL